MPNMFTQMDAVCHRFEELSIRLNQPDTAADPALFRRLMREYHDAEPVVQAYRAWQTAQDHLAQAKALLEEPGALDPDFKQMIQQEISEKSQDVEKLENNLKILLLPKDVNDGKNVIVEIRGGAGGEEAALFAHSLLRMYTMYVQSRGWQLEMLNLNETELGGVKEAIFSVDGAGAYNRLKYESGGIFRRVSASVRSAAVKLRLCWFCCLLAVYAVERLSTCLRRASSSASF